MLAKTEDNPAKINPYNIPASCQKTSTGSTHYKDNIYDRLDFKLKFTFQNYLSKNVDANVQNVWKKLQVAFMKTDCQGESEQRFISTLLSLADTHSCSSS